MRAHEFLLESKDIEDQAKEFLILAQQYLKLDSLPEIEFLQNSLEDTFGHYSNGKIEVVVAGRHRNDVFRTLAHELVHYKQDIEGRIHQKSGETGSNEENEANSEAGVIMRHYNHSKENALEENFADGKKPGRKGLAKRLGVNCKSSVSALRKVAKNSSGEKQRMAHWCANMKSGKRK